MHELKFLLATEFLKILTSYEIGNKRCHEDLLLYMQYVETSEDEGIIKYNNFIKGKLI